MKNKEKGENKKIGKSMENIGKTKLDETTNNIINFGFLNRFVLLAGIILFISAFSGMAFAQVEVDKLLEGNYINNQCFLCYDICQNTVTELEHEMFENITLDKRGAISSKKNLDQNDVEEALKKNYVIKYSVYTDYMPPTFLKDNEGSLIDSRYRGKMIFLGEEYDVLDWDDEKKSLKLAKGEERKIDNKAFGGDFTTKKGTYKFRIHRVIFSADQVAGIVVDVKKPDGTEIQVIAQRSVNAVISEDIEIYASNVAMAGNSQADITVYDLSTEIKLNDGEWFSDKKEWYVEMEDVNLGCLVNLGDGAKGNCGGGSGWISTEPSDTQNKFKVYGMANGDYGSVGMLKAVHLTLRTGFDFEPCYEDSECETKNCVKGICREEGYCGEGSDCLPDQYCSDNACKTLKSINSSCSEDSECETKHCSNNKCEKPPEPRSTPPDLPRDSHAGSPQALSQASSQGPPPGTYLNNQCFLCYDICQNTVVDLGHKMHETITINEAIDVYDASLDEGSMENAVKSAGEDDTIKYSVYTDYLPPTFLKDKDGNLVDSRYRGKMLFLGEEYNVLDWDDNEKILKLAKGFERKIDNKALGGDVNTKKGTYQFKIHRQIFKGEGKNQTIAGIVINVTKPDGTEIQAVAQRSLNAVVGSVEIYVSNVATAGDFAVADVMVYDLSTEINLKDREVFSNDNEWYVEIEDTDIGCLVYISGDSKSDCAADSESKWETKSKNAGIVPEDREKFNVYGAVGPGYGSEGMLKWVHLTLKTSHSGELLPIDSKESAVKYNSDNKVIVEQEVEPEVEKTAFVGGLAGFFIIGLILFMILVIGVYLVTTKRKR